MDHKAISKALNLNRRSPLKADAKWGQNGRIVDSQDGKMYVDRVPYTVGEKIKLNLGTQIPPSNGALHIPATDARIGTGVKFWRITAVPDLNSGGETQIQFADSGNDKIKVQMDYTAVSHALEGADDQARVSGYNRFDDYGAYDGDYSEYDGVYSTSH